MTWHAAAACTDPLDDGLWDPLTGYQGKPGPGELARIAKAKAICARCRVQAECVTEGEEQGDVWTIRGGLTNSERRKIGVA